MKLERFLKCGEDDPRMHDRMKSAILRRGSQDTTIEDVLRSYGCRAAYSSGTRKPDKEDKRKPDKDDKRWITDISKVAHVMRVLKIQADELIDRAPPPFTDWRDGSRILFILGKQERSASDQRKAASVSKVVADIDLNAYRGIEQYLQQSLYARISFDDWEARLGPDLARRRFNNILRNGRVDLGAVIVLASPVANSAADAISEKILKGDSSPGRFLFSEGAIEKCDDRREPKLWDPEPCKPEEEGIRIDESATTLVRKRKVDTVKKQAQDCGMLLMSIGEPPLLILAAGHGALGTLAAANGLRASWKMESIRKAAVEAKRQYAYAFVEVFKMEVGDHHGEGWKFV